MNGTMIEFQSEGKIFQGYLSAAFNKGPGVIIIQEWWGLVDHIKDVCDRFADAGFTVLAPDLYEGETTKSPDQAGKMMMALNIDKTEKILRGAMDALLAHEACTSHTLGIVGFCMGGQLALYAAAANPDKISACVDFYGIHPHVHPAFHQMKAAILGFFGEDDHSVGKESVEKLQQELQAAGIEPDFTVYPGAGHAFFNDTRPEAYRQEPAEDTWRKMLIFLRNHVQ